MKSLIFVTLMAMLTALAAQASESHRITSVFPMDGGVTGGTRVTISGYGFDERGRSNNVYIGNSKEGVTCDPVPNECHSERIVCITDAFQGRDTYPITVSHGGSVASCDWSRGCTFQYRFSDTPEVTGISPQWVTATDQVTVTGQKFSQGDNTIGAFDFTMHIGDEERCNLDENKIGWSSFSCGVESGVFAGSQRVNVQMGQGGNAMISPLHNIDVYPQVSSVFPNAGSVVGGQKISIEGTSFSRAIPENVVTVHGAPCGVTKVDNDGLVCVTSPHMATSTTVDTFTDGKVQVDYWLNNIAINVPVETAIRDRMYLSPSGTAETSVFGSWNEWLPFRVDNYMLARFTTHFVATQTGDHVFKVAGDDDVELWLSEDENEVAYKPTWVTDADPKYKNRIAFQLGYTGGDFNRYSTQTSLPVALTAGKKYWMRVFVANAGGGMGYNVNVTMPNGAMITNPRGSQIALRSPIVSRPDSMAINATEIRETVWRHTVSTVSNGDTVVAATVLDEVTVANIWTNPETNITRFTISYTYENSSYLLSVAKNLYDNFDGAITTPKHTVHNKVFYPNVDGTFVIGTSNSNSEGSSSWLDSDTTTAIFAVSVAVGLFIAFCIGFGLIYYFVRGSKNKSAKKPRSTAAYNSPPTSPKRAPEQPEDDYGHYGQEYEEEEPYKHHSNEPVA